MYIHAIRYFHHKIITVVPIFSPFRICSVSRRESPLGQAQGERKWRGGRGLLPPWDGRKVEFSSPTLGSGLPCPSICTLRRDPWGSEASRALHRHRGRPNLKMLPLSLRAEVLHSLTATASPRGKKMEGWAGTPAPMGWKKS